MFIRHRSNTYKKSVKQEAVQQEQPLEQPSIAEVALQKVEEVMRIVPESIPAEDVEAFLNESDNSCEECPKEEMIAEEPVAPIGDIEFAQDIYGVPADDIAFLLGEE